MKHAIAKVIHDLQGWLVVVILVFATIDFGGIYPQAIYFTRLLVISSFFLQLVLFFAQDHYLDDFHPILGFPLFLFFGFIILICFQYLFGFKILENSDLGTISAYLTYDSLIQLVIYFLFFMTCLKIATKRQLVERLASAVILLTFVIAVLGLAQRLITDEKILWKAIAPVEWSFFGPFVNENHFGGFLGLAFPLALGLMHYRFDKVQREFASKQEKNFWTNWLALINDGVIFLFFLVIFTLVACFFSAARVSLFVLLFCCVAYFVAYGMKEKNLKFYLILLFILASSFLLVQWLNKDNFTGNFGPEHLKKAWSIRFDVARQSLGLFYEYPLFGTGLGTYGLISSKAVSRLINEVWWNHAHNDYVELLTDTGIIGFSLLIGAISTLAFLSFRKIKKNLSHWNKFIATQGLISVLCIAVMEFSDFHLRIPSIALLFTLQLALLFQSSYSKESHGGTIPSRHSRESGNLDPRLKHSGMTTASDLRMAILKGTVVFMGLALSIPIITFSTNDYLAFRLTQTTDNNRLSNLRRAVELQPSNAKLWYLFGREYESNARQLDSKDESALKLNREAIAALRKAAALSPSYDTYWYDLGVLEYAAGYEKEGLISLEKAVYWSPAMLKHSVYLLGVYLRESEKARPIDKKIKFLNKAKILYTKLQQLPVKPRVGDYGTWMGEHYYKRLERLVSLRNS